VDLNHDGRVDFTLGPDANGPHGARVAQKSPPQPAVAFFRYTKAESSCFADKGAAVNAVNALKAGDNEKADRILGTRSFLVARNTLLGITEIFDDGTAFDVGTVASGASKGRYCVIPAVLLSLVVTEDGGGAAQKNPSTDSQQAQIGGASNGLPQAGITNPVAIYSPEPQYSDEAHLAKLQGSVLLSLVVDETGNAVQIKVLRPLGLGLDEKAVQAVSQWKFKPGTKDGTAVPVQAQIEVTFRLLDNPLAQAGSSALPSSPYVRNGSIGNVPVETPVNNWSQFKYIPFDEWLGKRVIFLPKPAGLRQFGYQFFQGGSGQFGLPTYAEAAGKIGRIVAVEGGQFPKVVIELEGPGPRYVGTVYSGTLSDIAFLDEIDQARKELTGKTLWTLGSELGTYDETSGSFGSVKVKKFSPLKVVDVVVGWFSDNPIRLILRSETGEEGYVDVSISGTNSGKQLASLSHIDKSFSLTDPKNGHQDWPQAVWDAIQEEKVALGMTKDQVTMSWGRPKSIDQTVTAGGKSEQWIYGNGAYVYFTGGFVSGIQNEK
jgi:TonB family protein